MSYRVLHSARPRPAPTPDLLGLVKNEMRREHPHARFGWGGYRLDADGRFIYRDDPRLSVPIRSQALVLAFHLTPSHALEAPQRFAPHKPVGTFPRLHKKRGRVNRWLALSPALGSSVKKFMREQRKYEAEKAVR